MSGILGKGVKGDEGGVGIMIATREVEKPIQRLNRANDFRLYQNDERVGTVTFGYTKTIWHTRLPERGG
jgi:hypothetical protein